MNKFYVIILWLMVSAQAASASKILCAFPSPSRAQMEVASVLLKGLAAKGHQVTVLSSFPLDKPVKNYRDIVVRTDHLIEGELSRRNRRPTNLSFLLHL